VDQGEHSGLKKKLALALLLLFFLAVPLVFSSLFYWINCDTLDGWTITHINDPTPYSNITIDDTEYAEGNGSLKLVSIHDNTYVKGTHSITNISDMVNYDYWVRFWVYVRSLSWTLDSTWDNTMDAPIFAIDTHVGIAILQSGIGFKFALIHNTYWTYSTYAITAFNVNRSSTIRSLATWYYCDIHYTPTTTNFYVNETLDVFDNISQANTKPSNVIVNAFYSAVNGYNEVLYDWISISDTQGDEGSGTPPVPPTPPPTGTTIILTEIPSRIAGLLGIDIFTAGILASLFVMLMFILPVLIFSKNVFAVIMIGLSTMGFLTALAWLPFWLFLIVTLVIALMFAGQMREWITGRG
jgi:hypothetical protein